MYRNTIHSLICGEQALLCLGSVSDPIIQDLLITGLFYILNGYIHIYIIDIYFKHIFVVSVKKGFFVACCLLAAFVKVT